MPGQNTLTDVSIFMNGEQTEEINRTTRAENKLLMSGDINYYLCGNLKLQKMSQNRHEINGDVMDKGYFSGFMKFKEMQENGHVWNKNGFSGKYFASDEENNADIEQKYFIENDLRSRERFKTEADIREMSNNVKNRVWKVSETNSKNRGAESARDIFNLQGRHFDMYDYAGQARPKPEMTRSLSYNVNGQEIGSRYTPQKHRSYSEYSSYHKEDARIMGSVKEEGAINLSKESRKHDTSLSPTLTHHDNMDANTQGPSSPQSDSRFTPSSAGLGSKGSKLRTSSESASDSLGSPTGSSPHPALLSMAMQHGHIPQQLQQMLLVQGAAALGGGIPPHMQQLMQAQQSVVMQQQQKAFESALVQLNEQLQMNLVQQAHLLQEKKTNGKQTQQQLQQLGVQQQTINSQIQQLQVQQRQMLLACLMQPFSQGGEGQGYPWKDLGSPGDSEDMKPGLNGFNGLGLLNGAPGFGVNPLLQAPLMGVNGLSPDAFPFGGRCLHEQYSSGRNNRILEGPALGSLLGTGSAGAKSEECGNPLYKHGVCKWPGCDTSCLDMKAFNKHLSMEHTIDDKNTAQARVQMQIVSQLEIQLSREKELLTAMMQHLHTQPQRQEPEPIEMPPSKPKHVHSRSVPASPSSMHHQSHRSSLSSASLPTSASKSVKVPTLPHLNHQGSHSGLPPLVIPPQGSLSSSSVGHMSQPTTPTSGGLGPMRRRVSDKCNLPISAEIQRNREFYKSTDVRPPFTYASLIRQAIIESENKQLTLNEVYQWFQNTFAYFRRNEATWKNAVRHNLSLHKCFMRVENVKGAVWTVDEMEFYKRRPQKLTGGVSSNVSYSADNSVLYNDTINASIRAAIEQTSALVSQHNGSLGDGVEDLSMKSYNNSNMSSPIKSDSPGREDVFYTRNNGYMFQNGEIIDHQSPESLGSNQGLDLSPKSSLHGSPTSYSASQQFQHGNQEHDSSSPVQNRFNIQSIKKEHCSTMECDSPGDNQAGCMQMSAKIDQSNQQEEALNMKIESKETQNGVNDEMISNSENTDLNSGKSSQRNSPVEPKDYDIPVTYLLNNTMTAVTHS
ncbi:forkhead box protein P2-like isoform X2 [Mya arenaria]|uniref:forkhead box protein P2-like isoform X2 n=1 Tax=Mya arenaria TaxID=6604 RepID=UPI0022E256FB|nr:forkhead box protein P2-like isoform X2 [Mya arenaria]